MTRCCGMPRQKKQSPWERAAPKSAHHNKLTPAEKAAAKRKAKRAGRPYPNLVDNMRAAAKKPAKQK